MKRNLFSLYSALALSSAAVMLFFTFFTLGWFSDMRGWEWGFELQVNTADGTLTAIADIFWTLAPITLLFSLFLGIFSEKGERWIAIFSVSPLFLYALCQVLLFFGGKEIRLPIWATLFFLMLLGIFTVAAAFFPELEKFAALFPFLYLAVELFLFFLSMLLQEKVSSYYFSQLIAMGHTSYFRYTFILWSILFYHLAYALSLGFWALAKKHRSGYFLLKQAAPEAQAEALQNEEASEDEQNEDPEDPSLPDSITLEDLGIER